MPKRQTRRVKQTTLIMVGEGPHDKAFLKHMQSVFDNRESGQRIRVESADGGSPKNIIRSTIKKCHHADFDRRYILIDSDVTITQQDRDIARRHKIELIESKPLCLEGMLLEVIGIQAPGTSQQCKNILHPKLSGSPTQASAYAKLFSYEVLSESRKNK